MRAILFIVVGLFLGGCATFDQPFKAEFDRGPDTKKHYVYVDSQEQMDVLCGKPDVGRIKLGCATIPSTADGVCMITLYRNGSEEIKRHEEDHCQYGRWHS